MDAAEWLQQMEDKRRNQLERMPAEDERERAVALVRQIMVERRTRLAAEDAAQELVRDRQAATGGLVERAAAD